MQIPRLTQAAGSKLTVKISSHSHRPSLLLGPWDGFATKIRANPSNGLPCLQPCPRNILSFSVPSQALFCPVAVLSARDVSPQVYPWLPLSLFLFSSSFFFFIFILCALFCSFSVFIFSLHVCLCEGVQFPGTGVTAVSCHMGAGN